MNNHEERLLTLLKEQAYVPGIVTLSSGKISDFYIDCRRVSLTHHGMKLIGEVIDGNIWDLDPHENIHVVAGEGIGGMAIAVATTMVSDTINQAVCIRKANKDHGISAGSPIEGASNLPPGTHIFLLEDVVTSGQSVIAAAKQLSTKFHIKAIIALVDREEGGRQAIEAEGYKFHSVFTRSDFIGSAK